MVFRPAESNFCFNMKHSFLLAALIFAGQVLGGDVELNLGTLEGSGLISSSGVLIGSNQKTTDVTQSNSVTNSATYVTLNTALTNDLVWYSNIGPTSSTDIGTEHVPGPISGAVSIVTDGPNTSQAVSAAAFSYTLTSSVLATLDTSKFITLSFNVYVSAGNNNQKTQSLKFDLLSSVGSAGAVTYTNTNGVNTDSKDVTLTLSSETVASLVETGVDQKLIFVASDPTIVTGTNEAFTIKDIKLKYSTTVPEPATATLSLLTLVGLCVRRRRR